ncbi:MAG: replicative DNA helicase [Bacteroidota bacterium]
MGAKKTKTDSTSHARKEGAAYLPMPAYSRLPPQATELEEAVLSAAMIDKSAFGELAVLPADVFYLDAHRLVFESMLALYKKRLPTDLLMLVEEMKTQDTLSDAGGPSFLAGLSAKVTSSANVEHHARILVQKYFLREGIRIGNEIVKASYEPTVDPLDLVDSMQADLLRLIGMVSIKKPSYLKDVAIGVVTRIAEAHERGEMLMGVSTGFAELDAQTGGLAPGDLFILAARPGMGKTSLMLHWARTMASQKLRIGIISLEMSSDQLTVRLLSAMSGVDSIMMRQPGRLKEEDFVKLDYAVDDAAKLGIQIDDSAGLTALQIRSTARAMRQAGGLDILMIDYLGLVKLTNDSFRHDVQIGQVTKALKALAKEMEIPVLLLCQLSRKVETRGGDKRPQLSDLRDSGNIEEDADQVYFIYRPEYYNIYEDEEGNSLKGVTELIPGKNRHGGARTVRIRMEPGTSNFIGAAELLAASGFPVSEKPPY